MMFSVGAKLLNRQSISAGEREKVFAFIFGSTMMIMILIHAVRVVVRNEILTYYQLIRNEYHWSTSLLGFQVFAFAEAMPGMDTIQLLFLTFAGLYVSCLSMMYWLKKICIELPNAPAVELTDHII